MAFGKEIKRLRRESKISAQKLADMIGISADRLRKWEENDHDPRIEDVQLIEAFFGMSIEEIMKLKSIKKFVIVPNTNTLNKQLPLGELRITLKDHFEEVQKNRDFLQKIIESSLVSMDVSLRALLKISVGVDAMPDEHTVSDLLRESGDSPAIKNNVRESGQKEKSNKKNDQDRSGRVRQ
jgi:transcriptional regulator with XRE-family HTH domain